MPLARALATTLTPLRRLALFGVAVAAVLTSCGREPTAPPQPPARAVRGPTSPAVSPPRRLGGRAAALAPSGRVRGGPPPPAGPAALDPPTAFRANTQQIVVTPRDKPAPPAPASGEPM